MTPLVRNLLIVAVIAAAIVALPGAGNTAGLIGALISTGISIAFALIIARMYRERRVDIHSLGDRHRAILYASVAGIVFCLAGVSKMLGRYAPAGDLVLWLAVCGVSVYGLVVCWRYWKSEQAW